MKGLLCYKCGPCWFSIAWSTSTLPHASLKANSFHSPGKKQMGWISCREASRINVHVFPALCGQNTPPTGNIELFLELGFQPGPQGLRAFLLGCIAFKIRKSIGTRRFWETIDHPIGVAIVDLGTDSLQALHDFHQFGQHPGMGCLYLRMVLHISQGKLTPFGNQSSDQCGNTIETKSCIFLIHQ